MRSLIMLILLASISFGGSFEIYQKATATVNELSAQLKAEMLPLMDEAKETRELLVEKYGLKDARKGRDNILKNATSQAEIDGVYTQATIEVAKIETLIKSEMLPLKTKIEARRKELTISIGLKQARKTKSQAKKNL